MATHSSILVWKIGYSLWGRKELDMTEQLTHARVLTEGGVHVSN